MEMPAAVGISGESDTDISELSVSTTAKVSLFSSRLVQCSSFGEDSWSRKVSFLDSHTTA